MNKVFTKIIIGAVIIAFSTIELIAQSAQSVISFETSFDNNYLAYISPIIVGKSIPHQGEEITLNEDGSFVWNNKSNLEWIQATFMPVKRDKQIGASFPLIITKNKESIKISYSDSNYVTVLDSDISSENKSLIEYSSFSNIMRRKKFMSESKVSEVTFDANDYLLKADSLINENNITNSSVLEYLKAASYNNYINVALNSNDNSSSYSIPEDYLNAVNNHWTLTLYNGISNLDKYFDYVANISPNGKKTLSDIEKKIEIITKQTLYEPIKNNLLESMMSKYITSYKIIDKESFNTDKAEFSKLVSLLNDSNLEKKLIRSFSNLFYTSMGSEMPEVVFKDTDGNEVSLNKFRGKYIYIDLWASWCAPCIGEVPHLIKLEHDYADKNIEFVSISLDSDKKSWLKKVEELSLKGNQWEIGNSELDKIMNITGIPQFLLYDTEGKLMMYNAPRPSSSQIRTVFNQILN